MKRYFYLLLVLCLAIPAHLNAEEFFGAPVAPDSQVVSKTENRLEATTDQSHDEIVAYYREALKELPDIKFRNWKDATYIEDDGSLKWHSITIDKEQKGGVTHIVMKKDTWTWIIGTLVLRFFGVFIVLLILLLGMSLSGTITSRLAGDGKK